MKLSQYKNKIFEYIKERWFIIKINFHYSWIESLDYYGKDWMSLASTIFYNLTFIIFIKVVYGKVNAIAGYSFDEMMLLILIGEITIILITFWIKSSYDELQEIIWSGSLDLILNKPLPALWYLTFRKFNVVDFIRNGLPPVIMIAFLVNWSKLNLTFNHLIAGIFIAVLGQIILNNILFVVTCFGGFFDKKGITVLADQTIDDLGRRIPIEGHNFIVRSIFLTILPIGIAMGLAASVMLGKFYTVLGLLIALAAMVFTTWFRVYFWNYCLRNYSSASS